MQTLKRFDLASKSHQSGANYSIVVRYDRSQALCLGFAQDEIGNRDILDAYADLNNDQRPRLIFASGKEYRCQPMGGDTETSRLLTDS